MDGVMRGKRKRGRATIDFLPPNVGRMTKAPMQWHWPRQRLCQQCQARHSTESCEYSTDFITTLKGSQRCPFPILVYSTSSSSVAARAVGLRHDMGNCSWCKRCHWSPWYYQFVSSSVQLFLPALGMQTIKRILLLKIKIKCPYRKDKLGQQI